MSALQVLLLEHDDVEGLHPFTDTHCSWEIRAGLYTIVERWTVSLPEVTVSVVSHRDLYVRSFVERNPNTAPFASTPTLVMSGHVFVSPTVMRLLAETCVSGRDAFLIECGGQIVGAFIPQALSSPTDAIDYLQAKERATLAIVEIAGHVVNRMWQVLDHVSEAIAWDASLVEQHISPKANVHQTVILDRSSGPIIIDDNVSIDAYSVLKGPIAIGKGSSIKPHCSLNTVVLGPHSRVGGEIHSSVVQGWSNKQHDGFLGHSYVGEWVNLGAGTTTSNLKNDYGHVRVLMPWGEEDSQRMFLGLLIGDHSKTAIGTCFSTGTICGVSSNVVTQSFAPKSIASFRWLDDVYLIEKALQVARTAMARRAVVLGPDTEAILRYLAG